MTAGEVASFVPKVVQAIAEAIEVSKAYWISQVFFGAYRQTCERCAEVNGKRGGEPIGAGELAGGVLDGVPYAVCHRGEGGV